MAFSHSKNCRVYIDAFDMSGYLTEASMMAKTDTPDVTTFPAVAGAGGSKKVIPGIKEQTLQLKGLFDPRVTVSTLAAGSTAGPDIYLHYIIAAETGVGSVQPPTNLETCVSVAPEGSWAPGRHVWAAANVISDYQVSSPVKNVVSLQATFVSDGVTDTGVSLHDPTVSEALPTTYVNAVVSQVLPVTTLNLSAAPSTYPTSGQLLVPVAAGYSIITYTGVSGSTFTGCTGGTGTTIAAAVLPLWPGTGVNDQQVPQNSTTGPTVTIAAAITLLTTPFSLTVTANPITAGFPQSGNIVVPISGSTVTLAYSGLDATHFLNCTGGGSQVTVSGSVVLSPISSAYGAYGFLHVGQVTGAGSTGVQLAKLQHSDDNTTWSDVPGGAWTLGTFNQGQYGTGQYGGGGIPGGYILTIPSGTQILRFVRTSIAYSASSLSTVVLVTFIRL